MAGIEVASGEGPVTLWIGLRCSAYSGGACVCIMKVGVCERRQKHTRTNAISPTTKMDPRTGPAIQSLGGGPPVAMGVLESVGLADGYMDRYVVLVA
jgi:hypothetical protein